MNEERGESIEKLFRMMLKGIAILLFSFFLPCFHLFGSDKSTNLDRVNLKEFFSIPVLSVIHGYRKLAGKGIRSFCPMSPSCSTYGLHAVQKRGLFGFLDVVDRLNRCGHDIHLYPLELKSGRLLYLDPHGNAK